MLINSQSQKTLKQHSLINNKGGIVSIGNSIPISTINSAGSSLSNGGIMFSPSLKQKLAKSEKIKNEFLRSSHP